MIPAEETFDGTWPFKPRFFDGTGFSQHYVDEGQGDPVVCLHGEPTWGYLYRNFIPSLSETNRVIVPDHMGFGKSETPQDRIYTIKTHAENLEALVKHLDLTNITLVMQDWGGSIGAGFTLRNSERVKRLCLLNTACGYGGTGKGMIEDDGPERLKRKFTPWFKYVKSHYDAGTYYDTVGDLGNHVLSVMKTVGFQNTAQVNDTWIRAYSTPFLTREECIGAIEFPLDALEGRILAYREEGMSLVDKLKGKPAMLAVGMMDGAIDPEVMFADFRALFPDGPIVRLPNAGHYCQEDVPETLVALIQQFMQMTPN